jgi:hypothetical protein
MGSACQCTMATTSPDASSVSHSCCSGHMGSGESTSTNRARTVRKDNGGDGLHGGCRCAARRPRPRMLDRDTNHALTCQLKTCSAGAQHDHWYGMMHRDRLRGVRCPTPATCLGERPPADRTVGVADAQVEPGPARCTAPLCSHVHRSAPCPIMINPRLKVVRLSLRPAMTFSTLMGIPDGAKSQWSGSLCGR